MKLAWVFPGQGSQTVGMGRSFYDAFGVVRHTFEEAEDLLSRPLRALLFEGPQETLTETSNSQLALYVVGTAIARVVSEQFPDIVPSCCAGHSLGEYTALTAAGWIDFADCLMLVEARGRLMAEACNSAPGGMAAILGLTSEQIRTMVAEATPTNELWAANFNCPGQTVISGTKRAVEAACEQAKALGARRALPLDVHGAFHSGLMQGAQERLLPMIDEAPLRKGGVPVVMNATAVWAETVEDVRQAMGEQICSSVLWEQGVGIMVDHNTAHALELGGKVLAGMNKRCGLPTTSVAEAGDLAGLEKMMATLDKTE